MRNSKKRSTVTKGAVERLKLSIMKNKILRALIEVLFIDFLFYSNLLMGEYMRTGLAYERGFAWAVENIFTTVNVIIGVIAAIIGYAVVEFLRQKL
jgi:hypothetical protein